MVIKMTKEKDKLRDNELRSFLDKYLNNSDIELLAIRTKAENFVKFEGEYGKILLALGVSDDRIVDYIRVYETPYVKFNKKIFKDIRTVLIEFDPHRYSRYDIFMSHFIKSNLWTKEDANEKREYFRKIFDDLSDYFTACVRYYFEGDEDQFLHELSLPMNNMIELIESEAQSEVSRKFIKDYREGIHPADSFVDNFEALNFYDLHWFFLFVFFGDTGEGLRWKNK